MDQLINQVLHDRYQIQSLLGRQIGRRTFLATDLQTEQSVVIKLLLFNPDFNWDDLKLFERETEVLKSLDHAAIPKYLDYFEVEIELGKGSALVQTYIEARSLQDSIQSGRTFSEDELKAIAKDLLKILDYLHQRQPSVVHRDIKPSNILIGDRTGNSPGQVYLVDFGSVQTATPGGTITIVGTYGYMPPEQFGGRTIPASDLYSLGATLIYLLTRTHPADLPSRNGCIQFETESLASEQFQTWLKYLIQPDLNQRFKSAQLALAALQSNQPIAPKGTIRSKPKGSRVILTKTNEPLKIVIPSLPVNEKLQVICSVLYSTAVLCSPLLLGFWQPAVSYWFAPLVVWMVYPIWKDKGYKFKLFAKTQLSIDQEEVYLTRYWLGFKKRYTAQTKDIIRLERQFYKKNHKNSASPKTQPSGLYIWLGDQRHSLRGLTEVELDWLAFELSAWLDLPLHTNSEVATPNNQSRIPAESNSLKVSSNPVSSSPSAPYEHSRISRPIKMLCTISQDNEAIEISTLAESNNSWAYWAYVTWIISGWALLAGATISPLIILPLTTISCIFLIIQNRINKYCRHSKIVLRIAQSQISLYKQFQSQSRQYLKITTRDSIKELELAYTDISPPLCQITISTRDSPQSLSHSFLVGNRYYWLSRTEADWLAQELSIWLKLPVIKRQVVVENNIC